MGQVNTRATRSLPSKLLKVMVCAGVGILIVELSFPFLGFFWHMTHGDSVGWLEWRFRVPTGFFVVHSHDDGHPVMLRYAPVIPFLTPRSRIAHRFLKLSMISILGRQTRYAEEPGYVPGYTAEERYSAAERGLVHDARLEGLALQSRRTESTPAGVAVCLQFGAPGVVQIRCFFKRDTSLLVLYDGEPDFTEEVYSVVRDITAPKNNNE